MNAKIIADSCCDLTEDMKKELNAVTVPLLINVGNQTIVDDETLDVKYLLKTISESKEAAKTNCPSPEEFLKRFRESAVSFCVTLSSKLSGSHNSALVAKELLEEEDKSKKVHVFDSLSASAGEVLVVLKIKEFIDKNLDFDTIVDKVTTFISGMKTYFVLDNLETLIKNGRIKKLAGLIAAALNLRPIMGSDGHGNIKLYEKIRGTQKALIRLADMIGEQCENLKERILVIAHCNNEKRANFFKQEVKKRHNFKDIIIVETRGISTVYANDGGLVIAY